MSWRAAGDGDADADVAAAAFALGAETKMPKNKKNKNPKNKKNYRERIGYKNESMPKAAKQSLI